MKTRSLQSRLNIMLICFVAIPLLVMTMLITVTGWRAYLKQESNALDAVLNSIDADVSIITSQTESVIRTFADADSLRGLVKARSDADWANTFRNSVAPDVSRVESYLTAMDANVFLICERCPSEHWYMLLNSNRFTDSKSYKDFIDSGLQSAWYGLESTMPESLSDVFDFRRYGKKLVYYYKAYGEPFNSSMVIRCTISPQPIMRSALLHAEGCFLTIVSDGDIVFSGTPADIAYPTQLQDESTLISDGRIWRRHDFSSPSLTILLSKNIADIRSEYLRTSGGTLLLVFLSVLLVFVISKFAMNSVLRRLRRIANAADSIHSTNDRAHLPEEGEDEVGHVVRAFNSLFDRIDAQMAESIQKEKDKNYIQALALQYQLNPHFLFNSLLWLQMELEQHAVDPVITENITKLGSVLRYSLSESTLSTLDEEIAHLQAYIEFMCNMKRQKITLCIDSTPDTGNVPIPRFLLQPVVENALQHGLVYGKQMDITVFIRVEESHLHIEIANNGKEISPERLAQLRMLFRRPDIKNGSGLGLSNLVQRLNLYYADMYTISVSSDADSTSFCINIPRELGKGAVS